MDKIKDGGPAFSCAAIGPSDDAHIQEGMSLRDWYAGMALQGYLSNMPTGALSGENVDIFVGACFEISDAMLKAREK